MANKQTKGDLVLAAIRDGYHFKHSWAAGDRLYNSKRESCSISERAFTRLYNQGRIISVPQLSHGSMLALAIVEPEGEN